MTVSLKPSLEQTIKVYLHYKMITLQNVSSEAQVIIFFFVSSEFYVPFSRYSSFCIFNCAMIYQLWDIMMTGSHNSLSHQAWPTDRYK